MLIILYILPSSVLSDFCFIDNYILLLYIDNMNIKDFCEKNNIPRSTIYSNIRLGNIVKTGYNQISDESAAAFIERYKKNADEQKRTCSCVLEIGQWVYIDSLRKKGNFSSKNEALRHIIDDYMITHKL